MAEEKVKDEEIQEEAPKGGKLKLIIIILVILGILGGGGAFVWFKFVAPAIGVGGEATKKEEEVKKEASKKIGITSGPMFPIDSFIINLAGEEGKRFLKLTMELELSDEALNPEITANLPKIKDSVLILLSSKSFKDIYTVDGKFKLRDEITARINRFLVTGHIRSVYFTEFVIQ